MFKVIYQPCQYFQPHMLKQKHLSQHDNKAMTHPSVYSFVFILIGLQMLQPSGAGNRWNNVPHHIIKPATQFRHFSASSASAALRTVSRSSAKKGEGSKKCLFSGNLSLRN